jgi:hypothetical protein
MIWALSPDILSRLLLIRWGDLGDVCYWGGRLSKWQDDLSSPSVTEWHEETCWIGKPLKNHL